jgi:hypothetical protein
MRFIAGSSGTVDFFNGRGDLRARFSLPQNGSENILYSDADGLARVVFQGTGAANLFEFDAAAALTAPPSAPEPGGFLALLTGTLVIAAVRLFKR